MPKLFEILQQNNAIQMSPIGGTANSTPAVVGDGGQQKLPLRGPMSVDPSQPQIGQQSLATERDLLNILGFERNMSIAGPGDFGQEEDFNIGKFALDLGKAILQAPQRAVTSVAIQPAADLLSLITGKETKAEFVPKSRFEKAVFGKDPIKGIFEQQKEASQFVDTFAEQNIDDPNKRELVKGANLLGSPLFVAGLVGLDLLPGGGGRKQLTKESVKIAATESVDDVVKSLLKVFKVSDDVAKKKVDDLAGQLVKMDDAKRIEKVIKGVDNLAFDTPEIVSKKVVSQKFRGDKLNLPVEQTDEITKRLEPLGLVQRTVRTHDDVARAAQELGTSPKALLKDTATNRITDVEVKGLRDLINNNAQFITKGTDDLLNKSLSKADKIALQRQVNIAEQQLDTALKKLVKGGTEAGRAVAAFRMMANNTLEPSFWITKAKKTLGNQPFTDDMRNGIIDLISKKDRQGLANFISMLRKPSFAEQAVALWKAGLLTSPTTHLANIGGNLTMRALLTASDVVGTGLDVLASVFTGKRTQLISPKTIAATFKGFGKGVKESGRFLKTGVYSEDLLTKWDLPRQTRFKNKILDGYTQSVFRSLGAEDLPFRQAAMQESLEKQAILTAKNEGLKGVNAVNRTRELLVRPSNEMVANAIDAAEFATFQSKNALADLLTGAKRATSEGVRTGVEVIAPFTKTPTNIAARIADFSPAGFVKAMVRFARPTTRSQKNLVDDLSRAITGTGMIAFGAYLAEKGLMTGNLPTGQKERDDFFAQGKQPNSIRIDGKWYQLNRVSPVGNLLSLGAEFNELQKDKKGVDLISSATGAAAKGLTEQTFLKGVSGGLGALTEPERKAQKFIEQTTASLVPSVVGRLARTIDPTLRVSDGVLETVKARIPFMSDDLPARRDVFGNIVEVSGGRMNLVDPFATKAAVDNPIFDEAKELGLDIGIPTQTIDGFKMSNQDFGVYQEIQGQFLEENLKALIENPKYKELSNVEKEKQFKKTISASRDLVNDSIWPAIMINRFDLPADTPAPTVRELMKIASKVEAFDTEFDEEEKGRFLRLLLESAVQQ